MSKVNIGGDPNDPCYRYKRELIQVSKTGKAMWCISNIKNICKQLQVREDFLNKFYGEIKRKGIPMIGVGQFKGMMSVSDLEKILNKLIDAHILCPKCKLPEWSGEVCSACGFMKATVVSSKVEEEDEKECLHYQQALKYVHQLYDMRETELFLDKKREYEEIIDHFWTLQDCASDNIKETSCSKTYKTFCKQYQAWEQASA